MHANRFFKFCLIIFIISFEYCNARHFVVKDGRGRVHRIQKKARVAPGGKNSVGNRQNLAMGEDFWDIMSSQNGKKRDFDNSIDSWSSDSGSNDVTSTTGETSENADQTWGSDTNSEQSNADFSNPPDNANTDSGWGFQGSNSGSNSENSDSNSDNGFDDNNNNNNGFDDNNDNNNGFDNNNNDNNDDINSKGDDDNKIPECACVARDLCDAKDVINTDGGGIVGWRAKPQDCGDDDVCCTKPKNEEPINTEEPVLTEPTEESPKTTTQLRCGENTKFTNFAESENVGGNFAKFGEFPWALKLLSSYDTNGQDTFRCGATLIEPDVALTAAHCLVNNSNDDIIVRAGEWNIENDDEPLGYQERKVRRVLTHPAFNHRKPKNDIALLFLESAFDLTDNVNTICLPTYDQTYDTTRCGATGWGRSKMGGEMQNIPKKIYSPIVAKPDCQAALRKTLLGKYFILHETFLCAGGLKDQDTCVGDGGSPLMCKSEKFPDTFVLVGLVSWGIECGAPERPGVYVDVSKFIDWIDEELRNENA